MFRRKKKQREVCECSDEKEKQREVCECSDEKEKQREVCEYCEFMQLFFFSSNVSFAIIYDNNLCIKLIMSYLHIVCRNNS